MSLVVYFGGTGYDGVAGTDRRMADGLAVLTPVLYVDPPRSVLTPLVHPHLAASLRGPALREVRAGLWWLTPRVLPGAQRSGMRPVTDALIRRAARRAAAGLGMRVPAVVVAGPGDLLGAVPGARAVYYATDDLVAGATLLGHSARHLRAAQARQLARADAVAVVSPVLRERFAGAVVIPNGCTPVDADAAPWPDDVPGSFAGPVAGFVGHINARIDLTLLEAVAGSGRPLLLVGPHDPSYEPARFAALVARANVCWPGRKPAEELASYLRVIDVGLTPYATSDFNRASFPIKTLDYLAAGRGVVSTDLPATAWLGTDLVRTATRDGFAAAVEKELATPRTPELQARRRGFAERHTWSRRARDLAALLGLEID
ncbi:glycosyltransferase [Actinoallomurus sp. NPDC050550]|uniref:glycosyltransferase n=1 Tax=Actinoallomurus sp. NPDC050550 TaxID=3154937 RepID=UPI0033F6F057